MAWVSCAAAVVSSHIAAQNHQAIKPAPKAPESPNCINCGAPEEFAARCSYCKTINLRFSRLVAR